MKINRNNYEAYFIDYLEGVLDEKMVDDFIEFLQQNPDLKEELSLFETVSVGQEEITFNKKELLMKEKYDAEKEFNEAAVAIVEGEISSSEKTEFENYLSSHPEKQKEAELFSYTKLQPDESILFNKKNKIYRRSPGRTVLFWSLRAAAVIVVALSVYTFIDKSSDKIIIENQVAVIEKEPEKKVVSPVEVEVPEKTDKKEVQPIIKKETEKQVIKKENPKPEPTKSLRENSKGRLENNDLALIHAIEVVPDELRSLNPTIYAGIPKTDLIPVKMVEPETIENIQEEKYLVDVMKEKTGLDKLSFNKITKAGLSLVANLSKEKFNYETNAEGKVTELKYDSRILAFSIPTKNEVAQK